MINLGVFRLDGMSQRWLIDVRISSVISMSVASEIRERNNYGGQEILLTGVRCKAIRPGIRWRLDVRRRMAADLADAISSL